jgi:hypothetical protein
MALVWIRLTALPMHLPMPALTCSPDGAVLRILSSGLQPPNSFLTALIDIAALPLLRSVWVFHIISGWFRIALNHAK